MYETLLLISQAVKSGIPLSAAIRLTIGEQPQRRHAALLRLASLLDQGIEPKVAAAQSGLPSSAVDLLDAALTSDDFAGTFDELVKLEISRSLAIHRVLHALAYPVLLLGCTILVLYQILVFTVPQFETVYEDFGTALPVMTKGIIQLSHLARSPVFLLECAAILVVLCVAVRFLFPRFWLCVPVLGNIGRSLYMARMLRQLAGHILRKVPLPDALEQCGKTMRNSAYRKDCRFAAEASRRGMPFWEIALRRYWLFPAWLAPMLAVEQPCAPLSKSLLRAAETVEQQADTSLLLLQSFSLPVFIIIVFNLVAIYVAALFMPLVSLITCLSS
jgi:type II secretory pathway component PulF